MRTAIFDLDGTLADTSGDLIAAANACFASDGLALPLDPITHASTAFAGGRAMLNKGAQILGLDWTEADIDRHYPVLLQNYGNDIDRYTVIYDGAQAALDRLKAAGWALGVCTNKPEGLAETLLQRLNMRGSFDALIGADTLATRKPDAAPLLETIARAGGASDRAVLVGDTITDAKTGRAAGVPTILVTFGPDGRAVDQHGPDALLDHYDDLDAVLDRLIAP